MTRERLRQQVKAQAELHAEERVLDALVGPTASPDTRQKFRTRLRQGELDDTEVEIAVHESGGLPLPTMATPGRPGASVGLLNLGRSEARRVGTKCVRRLCSRGSPNQ